MKHLMTAVILCILALTLLISCGNGDDETDFYEGLSQEGEACLDSPDCDEGLKCLDEICVKDDSTGDGDTTDGDVTDGDTEDGDTVDGDTEDGDVEDGDTTDGDNPDIYLDADSGLSWQNADAEGLNWEAAVAYCEDLDFGGSTDWRLPTIDELRSLVRGCEDSATGGACGVTATCLELACMNTECVSCERDAGPGTSGRYYPAELSGEFWWYWSADEQSDQTANAWALNFTNAGVSRENKNSYIQARCVY